MFLLPSLSPSFNSQTARPTGCPIFNEAGTLRYLQPLLQELPLLQQADMAVGASVDYLFFALFPDPFFWDSCCLLVFCLLSACMSVSVLSSSPPISISCLFRLWGRSASASSVGVSSSFPVVWLAVSFSVSFSVSLSVLVSFSYPSDTSCFSSATSARVSP